MTLYAHFPSKDDLIVASLEQANEQFWAWLDGAWVAARMFGADNAAVQVAAAAQALIEAHLSRLDQL